MFQSKTADRKHSAGAWALRAALLACAVQLAGCGPDRMATGSIVPDDYRERHPIVLNEKPITTDVFVTGNRLDSSSAMRIREFAAGYNERGRGPIAILVPRGGRTDGGAALDAVRRELAAGGARTPVQVGSYAVQDPLQASPIRLSYLGMQARVASRCGEWPADLASGSSVETWENRPYWNHGCSTQQNLALMVADPRDLVTPRGESTSDVQMRIRAIKNVRNGAEPGTSWKTQNTNIGQAGGN